MRDPQAIFNDLFTHRGNYTQYNTPQGQLDLIRFARENQLGNYTHPDSPDKGLWVLPPITFVPEWNTTDLYVEKGDLSRCTFSQCNFFRAQFDTVKLPSVVRLNNVRDGQFYNIEIQDDEGGLFFSILRNTTFSQLTSPGPVVFSDVENCEVNGGAIGRLFLGYASNVTVQNVKIGMVDLSLAGPKFDDVRFMNGCQIQSVSRPDFTNLYEIVGLDLEGSEVNNWDASDIRFNRGIKVNNYTAINNSNFERAKVNGEYPPNCTHILPNGDYKGLALRQYFECQGAKLDNVNFGHNPVSLLPTSTPAPPPQPPLSTMGIILLSTLIPGGLIFGTVLGVAYKRYRNKQNARTNLDIFREEQIKQDRRDARVVERLSHGDIDRLVEEGLLEADDQIIPFFQAGERRSVPLPKELIKKILQARTWHAVARMDSDSRDDRELALDSTWEGIKQSRVIATKIQAAKYYLHKGLSIFCSAERSEESRDIPLQEIVVADQENHHPSSDGKDKGEMDESTPLLGSIPTDEMMQLRR